MGLEVGGYEKRPNRPKMGPSLPIATCLILAIRTARWPARRDTRTSEMDLEAEIDHAAHLAGSVLSRLMAMKPSFSPSARSPGSSQTMTTCRNSLFSPRQRATQGSPNRETVGCALFIAQFAMSGRMPVSPFPRTGFSPGRRAV